MVFDKLKGIFTLRGGKLKKGHPLYDALCPIGAYDPGLLDRCLSYVQTGEDATVLLDLRSGPLHAEIGDLLYFHWSLYHARRGSKTVAALESIGYSDDIAWEKRFAYYSSSPGDLELVRFAKLLAATVAMPKRTVKDVPPWVTVLLNDVAETFVYARPAELRAWRVPLAELSAQAREELPAWDGSLVPRLLISDGVDAEDAVSLAVLAFMERSRTHNYESFHPEDLPGCDELLREQGSHLRSDQVANLSADGRLALLGKAVADPAIANSLGSHIALSCFDRAKGVRREALKALDHLSPQRREETLYPLLLKASPARAADLIARLGQDDEGARLLDRAVADGAKIGSAVDEAAGRRAAVATQNETGLSLPPFNAISDEPVPARAMEEIRAWFAEERKSADKKYGPEKAGQVKRFSERDFQALVAVANGEEAASKIADMSSWLNLKAVAPSFNLIHRLRIESSGSHGTKLQSLVSPWLDGDLDFRAVHGALESVNLSTPGSGRSPDESELLVLARRWPPETSWAWFAQRPHILRNWLVSGQDDVAQALDVLQAFPQPPQDLLPVLADVALSDSRLNRLRAQAILDRSAVALSVAKQGLKNSRGEIRAVAAAWLGKMETQAQEAAEALHVALKTERLSNARAAMLTALEHLGSDTSSYLAPETLLEEATKGMKRRISPALAWLPLDHLPAVRWRDDTSVDPVIVKWWVVLANKIKSPDGTGLIDRYLSLLAPADAADLGRHILWSWIAQDTLRHSDLESRAHADAEAPVLYQEAQDRLAKLGQASYLNIYSADEVKQAAALSIEDHWKRAYKEHQKIYLTSAVASKGLLALTTRMPGIELAAAVQAYIRDHRARRSQVESLVYALYGNGDPACLQLLLSIATRFRQASIQEKAQELVERFADDRGWSADELADRTVPTAGFDQDGLLHLSYGEREFVGRINDKFGITLGDASGKSLSALPKPRATEDEEQVGVAKKKLSDARKGLKAVVKAQPERLYEAMCTTRSWPAADWEEHLLKHPLMSALIAALVWQEVRDTEVVQVFRPAGDGVLLDADDEPVKLGRESVIQLVHGSEMSADLIATWKDHLKDYEVKPLFEQFTAAAPQFTEGETEFDDFKGHLTDTLSFRAAALKRGYTRGMPEDGAWFWEYTKDFHSVGLTATMNFTGSVLLQPEPNFPCAPLTLTFTSRGRDVPLEKVPPRLRAECYADYASLGALGPFDPDYESKVEY